MDTIDLTPSAKEEILKMASQGLQIPHVTHPQHPSQIFHLVNFFCSCTKQCFGSKQRGGRRLRCGRHSGRQTECAANHSHSNAAGAVVRLVDLANHFPFVLFCGFNTTPSTVRIDFSVAFVLFSRVSFSRLFSQLPPSLSTSSRVFRSCFIVVSVAASAFASTALIALAPGPLIIVEFSTINH